MSLPRTGLGALTPLPLVDDPSSQTARSWLEDELARGDYQRSWWERLLRLVSDLFAGGAQGSGSGAALRAVAIGLVVAIVVGLVLIVLTRVRARSRRDVEPADDTVWGARPLDAAQYRERAASARAAGSYGSAVLDSFRAVAAGATDAGLLPAAPAVTAHEIGRRLGARFPEHAASIAGAAALFDAVRYGGATATARDADDVAELDARLDGAAASSSGSAIEAAVPR